MVIVHQDTYDTYSDLLHISKLNKARTTSNKYYQDHEDRLFKFHLQQKFQYQKAPSNS